MDKNTVQELGKENLVNIIIRLYKTSKNDYAYYQKKRKELEEQRSIQEADNTNSYSYAFNYLVGEIEKALGKKAFQALVGGLVSQGEGKLTLVPADDKRVEFASADADFQDLLN